MAGGTPKIILVFKCFWNLNISGYRWLNFIISHTKTHNKNFKRSFYVAATFVKERFPDRI